MAFELLWTEAAKRDLNGLPRELVIRIIKKAEFSKQNPYRFMNKLAGRPEWRLRVGDYRVLCEIDFTQDKLKVLAVRHRSTAYAR